MELFLLKILYDQKTLGLRNKKFHNGRFIKRIKQTDNQ